MEDLASAIEGYAPPAEPVGSVKLIELPPGSYRITVTDGAPSRPLPGEVVAAALMISPAPVSSEGQVELVPGHGTFDRWLRWRDDSMTVVVHGTAASLLLTSVRPFDAAPMAIDIRLLEAHESPAPQIGPAPDGDAEEPSANLVPLGFLAHIQRVGEVEFAAGTIAGPNGDEWIEGFAILPQTDQASILEYSGVRADGAITPWHECGEFCGTRGMGLALFGFSLRIKPPYAETHDCAYGARFASGRILDSLHDGALCQSDMPDDPILAMEVRLFEHRVEGRKSGAVAKPQAD